MEARTKTQRTEKRQSVVSGCEMMTPTKEVKKDIKTN